jgi:hypothetical protein
MRRRLHLPAATCRFSAVTCWTLSRSRDVGTLATRSLQVAALLRDGLDGIPVTLSHCTRNSRVRPKRSWLCGVAESSSGTLRCVNRIAASACFRRWVDELAGVDFASLGDGDHDFDLLRTLRPCLFSRPFAPGSTFVRMPSLLAVA